MDNLQKINETINNHKYLIRLTRQKIEILEEHDSSKYYTGHGIDVIDFEEDTVNVTCFEGCYGYREYLRFSFPIGYLLLSDDELISEVENNLSEEKKKEKEKQLKKQEWKQKNNIT
jgi:hypothetical protein